MKIVTGYVLIKCMDEIQEMGCEITTTLVISYVFFYYSHYVTDTVETLYYDFPKPSKTQ
jgi:hypothetical protein